MLSNLKQEITRQARKLEKITYNPRENIIYRRRSMDETDVEINR